jgi:hypothetical protein
MSQLLRQVHQVETVLMAAMQEKVAAAARPVAAATVERVARLVCAGRTSTSQMESPASTMVALVARVVPAVRLEPAERAALARLLAAVAMAEMVASSRCLP